MSFINEITAILQNKLLPKLKHKSFFITCSISEIFIDPALCDLKTSVSLMPLFICKNIQVDDLKLTTVSIQLTDHAIKHPMGPLEDFPL